MRKLLPLVLAVSVPLSGCFSVIPGYDFLGVPITQADRDDATGPQVFFWRSVPHPSPEYFNPGVLVLNLVTSAVIDVVGLALVLGVAAILSSGDGGDDDCQPHEHEHEHHRPHAREERPRN